jgi:hypothetical protein
VPDWAGTATTAFIGRNAESYTNVARTVRSSESNWGELSEKAAMGLHDTARMDYMQSER